MTGAWTTAAAVVSKQTIISIQYPIMAASVSDDLSTRTFDILVPDADAISHEITLEKMLPSLTGLVAAVNSAISESYPLYGGALPVFVIRAQGWYWENPTTTDITITYRNTNQQQLYLGSILTGGSYPVLIPSGGVDGPYRPDPRLGAVSQDLSLLPGNGRKIKLPLSGTYRNSILFRPSGEILSLSSPSLTAQLSVLYPSINLTQDITVSVPSRINISSDSFDLR